MEYNYRKCTCGAPVIIFPFYIIEGDKPFTEVAKIEMCGKCFILYSVKVNHSIFGINDDLIKRAYKATRISSMTMEQLRICGASDYDPNKFIAPRQSDLQEVPF